MKNTSAWAAAHAPAGTRWGKKALSLLLSLALCLGLLPGMAMAADAAAEVNGTPYDSLAEAITAAKDGSTVKLLKDVQTAEKITIENRSLTIDLNEKTWKRTGTLLTIDSNANVTVKGGTMDFTVKIAEYDETDAISLTASAGSLTLEDVSIQVTDGHTTQASTVSGYAISVSGGSLAIRGKGSYGRIYVNFNSGTPAVKLYGGSYTEINLNGGDGKDLLDKGYIFVDKDSKYVNVTGVYAMENLKVIACTHAGEKLENGYYAQCGAECEHPDTNVAVSENTYTCTKCSKVLAAQVTGESGIKYYIDLQEAFDEAAEGSTVKLLKAASGPFTVSTPIKLDCNGHTFNDKLTVSGSVTLASLLLEGHAFKNLYTNSWMNDSDLSGKTLNYFTTAEAPITSVTAENPTNSILLGQSVTLTADLEYPGSDDGFHLTWYCGANKLGEEDITVTGKTYSLDPITPASAGSYTYRLVFTRDGYSKSCTFTVTVTPTYTVTFDANGGTLYDGSETAMSVAKGEKVREPFPPTRDGYAFVGWYQGDRKWDFENDTVTEDITLTAKWASRDYTVTAYGLYGGAMGIKPGETTYTAKYAEGEPVGLQIGKREGYTLDQSNPLTLEGITESDLSWQAKEYEVTTRGIFFKMPAKDVTITVNWVKNGSSGGGSVSTYAVSVGKTEHGSVTVSPKSAAQGATVTVTVAPDKGYALETLTATDKDGKALTLTRKSDTQYSFSMPASDVTVQAAFLEDNT